MAKTTKKDIRKAFALMECAVAALNTRITEFQELNRADFSAVYYNAWRDENTQRLELIEEDLIDIL
jgi:hypothetical protein